MASISAGVFLPAEIGEVAALVVGSYIYVPTMGVDCLGGLSIRKVADWDRGGLSERAVNTEGC